MKKSKQIKNNKMIIRGVLLTVSVVIVITVAIFIIDKLSVPKEYIDALASLQDYNQNGCSILDQAVKQEYFAKSEIEKCLEINNYSNEAKEYAWKKANIDFEEKAVRLVQDFIESQGRIMEKHVGDADVSYEAAKKALRMNQEMFKSAWMEGYGYTEEQIDNAFEKVLKQ